MLRVRENRQGINRRIEWSRILVGAVFAILATSYWYTQIVRGDYYYTLSESNRIRSVRINAPRGYVLDRNGAILVDNEPAYTLHLYRREAKNLPSSIKLAAEVLKIPPEQVKARVDRGLRDPEFLPITIAENLGIEEVAGIEAHAPEHPEFAITVSQRRLYTHGASAAHALGYLSEASLDQVKATENGYRLGDWIGQKGIEGAYERLLAGVNGERRVIVDSHGRETAEERRLEARPGQNLFVTLDLGLQEIAEAYFKDKVGSAVALDPRTGEILALVSSPSYDPNWFTRRVSAKEWNSLLTDGDHPLQNRAIQNAFSPGSVFKVFIAYGALAQGLVDPNATVFCPGHAAYYGRTFQCHKKGGHGTVNLRNAIKMSCDVYFYALGHRLGVDRIAAIAKSFGFGSPTGVDLPYEKNGLVPSEDWALQKRHARWYPSETISVAIGQGPVLVTPLQIARALSALVEDGRLPTPHLFYASQEPHSGKRLRYRSETHDGIVLDPSKLAIVKDGMWAVLNEPGGTAFGSHVPGVEAAGKTGTVQVIGREATVKAGADKRKLGNHGWFAGFAPRDEPEMVVSIFVENGGHGNLSAAPLAKLLFLKRFGKPMPEPPAPPRPEQRAEKPSPSDFVTVARGGGARR
ncbi:MAG: penicillin-binding protein 2 [Acidobacteria bacterium]|nr:penicillin-binding protein 2 [Acidobacteriota bacterium]MCA1611020.1 penicillin-binding protein 2 [Acidobacteriota bacterium]